MRFFYYYPTHDKPSGGNKELRLHAALLREAGVETFLLRDERFFARPNSFDDDTFYRVPIELAPVPFERAGEHLKPDDVVILPEVLLRDTLATCAGWNCRVAVNNQNGFYGLRYGPPRARAPSPPTTREKNWCWKNPAPSRVSAGATRPERRPGRASCACASTPPG